MLVEDGKGFTHYRFTDVGPLADFDKLVFSLMVIGGETR